MQAIVLRRAKVKQFLCPLIPVPPYTSCTFAISSAWSSHLPFLHLVFRGGFPSCCRKGGIQNYPRTGAALPVCSSWSAGSEPHSPAHPEPPSDCLCCLWVSRAQHRVEGNKNLLNENDHKDQEPIPRLTRPLCSPRLGTPGSGGLLEPRS